MKLFSILLLPPFLFAQEWHESVSTHFNAIGDPFGACGVPAQLLDADKSSDYVALNVFNAPGNYSSPASFGPRPLTGANTQWLGAYENGKNCGRWVEIILGDDCAVPNGGEKGSTLCGGGTGWVADGKNGAKLYAVVTDQCTDDNLWCRDAPWHLDIRTSALDHFLLPTGEPIAPFNGSYSNRAIQWRFVAAPNLTGDIHITYSQHSKPTWKRIIVTNLPNGIHGVEQRVGTGPSGEEIWKSARMEGDMGQMFILPEPMLPEPLTLRIRDVDDNLVYAGRTYQITFPKSCGQECQESYVETEVQAQGGIVPPPLQTSTESGNIPSPHQCVIPIRQHPRFDLLGRKWAIPGKP